MIHWPAELLADVVNFGISTAAVGGGARANREDRRRKKEEEHKEAHSHDNSRKYCVEGCRASDLCPIPFDSAPY